MVSNKDLMEVKVLKKMVSDSIREVGKIRKELEKAKEGESIHQVKIIETRLDAAMESISIMEKDLLTSWNVGKSWDVTEH